MPKLAIPPMGIGCIPLLLRGSWTVGPCMRHTSGAPGPAVGRTPWAHPTLARTGEHKMSNHHNYEQRNAAVQAYLASPMLQRQGDGSGSAGGGGTARAGAAHVYWASGRGIEPHYGPEIYGFEYASEYTVLPLLAAL